MAPLSLPQPPDTSAWAVVEAINGPDTLRHRWPLRVGVVNMLHPQAVVVNDDTANSGKTDSSLAGRPAPDATYDWFFPNSTIAAVSGRWNGQVRLQLSHATVAWVDGVDVQPLSPDVPPSSAIVNSPRLLPNEKSVILRVPVTAHVPFRVDETEHSLALRIYSAVADMDWIRYTGTDPFVRLISFAQPAEDEVVLTVDLTQDVWAIAPAGRATTCCWRSGVLPSSIATIRSGTQDRGRCGTSTRGSHRSQRRPRSAGGTGDRPDGEGDAGPGRCPGNSDPEFRRAAGPGPSTPGRGQHQCRSAGLHSRERASRWRESIREQRHQRLSSTPAARRWRGRSTAPWFINSDSRTSAWAGATSRWHARPGCRPR